MRKKTEALFGAVPDMAAGAGMAAAVQEPQEGRKGKKLMPGGAGEPEKGHPEGKGGEGKYLVLGLILFALAFGMTLFSMGETGLELAEDSSVFSALALFLPLAGFEGGVLCLILFLVKRTPPESRCALFLSYRELRGLQEREESLSALKAELAGVKEDVLELGRETRELKERMADMRTPVWAPEPVQAEEGETLVREPDEAIPEPERGEALEEPILDGDAPGQEEEAEPMPEETDTVIAFLPEAEIIPLEMEIQIRRNGDAAESGPVREYAHGGPEEEGAEEEGADGAQGQD